MAKAVMIPRGNGLFKGTPLYIWVASLALKVVIGGWPTYLVGLCGRGVFLRNQKLARVEMLVARGHDQSSAENVDRDR
jgi:hypothetical protein